MRRCIFIILISALLTLIEGRGQPRAPKPRFELGGKFNLLLSDATAFGPGLEAVVNPLPRLGLRYEFFNVEYSRRVWSISLLGVRTGYLDALIYLPMSGFEPYLHAGIGMTIVFGSGAANGEYSFRGGMGLNHRLNKKITFFGETGVWVIDPSDGPSSTTFRLSVGGRTIFSK